jgi:hypothetical protein
MKEQPRLDWMVSCDDHILGPPTLWQDRIPAKYRDIAISSCSISCIPAYICCTYCWD